MQTYQKIANIFRRSETPNENNNKKLLEGIYNDSIVEYLKDNIWQFTEKIDGTNVRVFWDGYRVSFAGRKDTSELPKELEDKLNELFCTPEEEELFEQEFGRKEVILFGEGYGGKIQNGKGYSEDVNFALFDVCINGTYLKRYSVPNVACALGIKFAPTVLYGSLKSAVDYIKTKPNSFMGPTKMEGIVGVPTEALYNKHGERIIVKIKACDYK